MIEQMRGDFTFHGQNQDSDWDAIASWGPRSRQEGQRGRAGRQEAEVWHSLFEEQGRHRDSLSFGELNQIIPFFHFISKYNQNNTKSQNSIAAMLHLVKRVFSERQDW